MNWHASRSDEFRSPIVRGMARTSSKERARARVLTDEELRAAWKVAEATPGPFGPLVQFLLAVGRATLGSLGNDVGRDFARRLGAAGRA
jgi:hypothetical protein